MSHEEEFEKAAQRHYNSMLEDVNEAYAILTKDEDEYNEEHENDEDFQSLNDLQEETRESNYPAGATEKRMLEVTLSGGGPASGLYLFFTKDRYEWEVDSGFYWYQDWFQPKRIFWLSQDELDKVVEVYGLGIYE